MILPELKDKVVEHIVTNENEMYVFIDCDQLGPQLNSNGAYVNAILNELEQRRMIELMGMAGRNYGIYLQSSIFDFYRHGGYDFEETIMGVQLEKLKHEIGKLDGKIDTGLYDSIVGTVSLMIAAVDAFRK